ncbi:MAG: hypothetical protein ABSF14_21990, partial [Terriglobia bacterium]
RQQRDGCLVVLGSGLMAVLAPHPNGGVDEFRIVFGRVALQTCFRLNILRLNQRMFDHVLSEKSPNA